MKRNLWTNNELEHSVIAYIIILNFLSQDLLGLEKDVLSLFQISKLNNRSKEALNLRMSNISYCLQGRKINFVSTFSPLCISSKSIKERINLFYDNNSYILNMSFDDIVDNFLCITLETNKKVDNNYLAAKDFFQNFDNPKKENSNKLNDDNIFSKLNELCNNPLSY